MTTANQRALAAVKRQAAIATHRRFQDLCLDAGLLPPIVEGKFVSSRRWRFDYAWPEAKVALEVDGGVWVRGKHGRGSGIVKDHEKRNEAAALGWRVLIVQPRDLLKPSTLALVKRTLEWKRPP